MATHLTNHLYHERFASLLAGARPFENLYTNLQAPGPSRPGPNLTRNGLVNLKEVVAANRGLLAVIQQTESGGSDTKVCLKFNPASATRRRNQNRKVPWGKEET